VPTHTVHHRFLVDESHINPITEEIKLATLCVDYLNLPSFAEPPTEDTVLNGDYGFMEYAILNWTRHLEASAANAGNEQELMKHLVESLEIFIDLHWISPTANFMVSKRNSDRIRHFRDLPFYDKLEKTLVSSRKQLGFFGQMPAEEIALDLTDAVRYVRKTLERILSFPLASSMQANIDRKYGSNLFKCPRFSCQFFTTGFQSMDERDEHVEKHDRPFRCPVESCTGFAFGFVTEKDREKHMREVHSASLNQDQQFPTDKDIQESIMHKASEKITSLDEREAEAEEETASDAGNAVHIWRRTRSNQTEFICEYCGKIFKKKYNWKSHLLSHRTDRPYSCSHCGVAFVRLGDCQRHLRTQHGQREHVCSGVLKNGDRWGCNRTFSRADILKNHFKSTAGQACIRPLQEEELEPTGRGTMG
jgi:hypothetical protein